MISSGSSFLLTVVYGPSINADKPAFLQELTATRPSVGTPWLILGEFNIIYEARDKNNTNFCRRLMGQFRAAIDASELKEMRCSNRRFSWSNERVDPTLVYLDRFFYNVAWDALFSPCTVQALSSSHSDHCPLLLSCITAPPRKPRFRFENFWVRQEGFIDTVKSAWTADMRSTNPFTADRPQERQVLLGPAPLATGCCWGEELKRGSSTSQEMGGAMDEGKGKGLT
jgi:hypothetical protein